MPKKPPRLAELVRTANGGRRWADRDYRARRRSDPVRVEADRLRSSWRWQCVRRRKLREQPLCEVCLSAGVTTLATDVNHVVPVRTLVERGESECAFEMENLQAICRSHHVEATWRERRGRGGVK
jgi:5-methylcytosine-specific restriction endonuclease McrA